jgi:hypothetical protein
MPGLVPGIHVSAPSLSKNVEGRDKPGHDVVRETWPLSKRPVRRLHLVGVEIDVAAHLLEFF